MRNILEQIIHTKHEELAVRKAQCSLNELIEIANKVTPKGGFIDALRKQRRPEPEDLPWGPEAEPDQAEAIGLKQETEQLAFAIKELPEKQRILIEQAYFGDLSHSEIAEITGLPLGTIKSRIRLALERLRHAMK